MNCQRTFLCWMYKGQPKIWLTLFIFLLSSACQSPQLSEKRNIPTPLASLSPQPSETSIPSSLNGPFAYGSPEGAILGNRSGVEIEEITLVRQVDEVAIYVYRIRDPLSTDDSTRYSFGYSNLIRSGNGWLHQSGGGSTSTLWRLSERISIEYALLKPSETVDTSCLLVVTTTSPELLVARGVLSTGEFVTQVLSDSQPLIILAPSAQHGTLTELQIETLQNQRIGSKPLQAC